jgi:hypothetical protein
MICPECGAPLYVVDEIKMIAICGDSGNHHEWRLVRSYPEIWGQSRLYKVKRLLEARDAINDVLKGYGENNHEL